MWRKAIDDAGLSRAVKLVSPLVLTTWKTIKQRVPKTLDHESEHYRPPLNTLPSLLYPLTQ